MGIKFVGLGLGPKECLTGAAVDAIRNSDKVFLDTYTGSLPNEVVEFIKSIRKDVILADRSTLEDGMLRIVEDARGNEITLAVQGDPMIATTHISMLLEAARCGVRFRVIHGVSSYSAAISASGLHAYKFGRSVTLPSDWSHETAISVYDVIAQNMSMGMHTLVFLDTKDGGMKVTDALSALLEMERVTGKGIISEGNLAISIARLGYEDELVMAGTIKQILGEKFPEPPHMLILPGDLHFLEREVLVTVLGAEREAVQSYMPHRYQVSRIKKYQEKCERAFRMMRIIEGSPGVRRVLEVAESYKEDSKFFLDKGDIFDAISAISYSEGLLDALRMLGYVSFEW